MFELSGVECSVVVIFFHFFFFRFFWVVVQCVMWNFCRCILNGRFYVNGLEFTNVSISPISFAKN